MQSVVMVAVMAAQLKLSIKLHGAENVPKSKMRASGVTDTSCSCASPSTAGSLFFYIRGEIENRKNISVLDLIMMVMFVFFSSS